MLGIPHDGGTVNVGGNFPPKGLVEQVILGRGGEVFAAPNHMGNAHEMIVNDIGKIIGGQAVPLHQNLVVQGAVFHGDLPKGGVGEGGGPCMGDFLTDDIGLAGGQLGRNLLLGQAAAGVLSPVKISAVLLRLRFLAEAVIGVAFLHQQLGEFAIEPPALGLDIRPHRATHIGALVVGQSALGHGTVDELRGPLHLPSLVGVLQAEDELAAGFPGDEPGVQGGAEIAHVHVSGGRRGEPGADSPLGDLCLQLVKPGHIHRKGLPN